MYECIYTVGQGSFISSVSPNGVHLVRISIEVFSKCIGEREMVAVLQRRFDPLKMDVHPHYISFHFIYFHVRVIYNRHHKGP